MDRVVAPCGHPGEVVIGTYVRCLSGCEGEVERKRAEPGHAEMCCCLPCKTRREVVAVEFRTKDGRAIGPLPWDGVAPRVRFSMPGGSGTVEVRHWRMLRADGSVYAERAVSHVLTPGDVIEMRILAGCEVSVWGASPLRRLAKVLRYAEYGVALQIIDGAYLLPTAPRGAMAGLSELLDEYQARISALLACQFVDTATSDDLDRLAGLWPEAGSEPALRAAALRVPGVRHVTIHSPEPCHVTIEVDEVDEGLSGHDRSMLVFEVHRALELQRPAGIYYRVVDETPQTILRQVAARIEQDLVGLLWKPRGRWCSAWDFVWHAVPELRGSLQAYLQERGVPSIDALRARLLVDHDGQDVRCHIVARVRDREYGYAFSAAMPHYMRARQRELVEGTGLEPDRDRGTSD